MVAAHVQGACRRSNSEARSLLVQPGRMLVFADAERWIDPALALAHLQARAWSRPPDPESALDVLLGLGELYQGVLDYDLQREGAEPAPERRADLSRALHAAAEMYVSTLDGRGKPGEVVGAVSRLLHHALPRRVRARAPEGFAHYALLPQLYVCAARRLPDAGPARVLGIRTAGAVLGAVVAAALRAPPLLSVRPEGDPFARQVRASPGFKQALQRDAGARWLIVDEGPGQSGSSFLAVARLLEDCGVDSSRICLLPSHTGGPGAAAPPQARKRWSGYASESVSFDEHFARGLPFMRRQPPLSIGAEAVDLCGGRWRPLLYAAGELPPALRYQERRKYLFWCEDAPKLAKFAGLGRWGRRKLRRARCLAAAGFIAAPERLESGFLIGDWLAGSRPAAVFGAERAACLEFLGRYLAFVSTQVAARDDWGAGPRELSRMVERNTRLSLGSELADLVRLRLRELPQRERPVYVDGKLEPWEWLTAPSGLRKTDALDHAASHDLVRAQDIEWDIAGARIELDLSARETSELLDGLARRGAFREHPRRLAFFSLCYLAFKIGVLTMGEHSENEAAERERLSLRRAYYEHRLRRELLASG